ncbi:zinc finger protein 888-like isoform X2 [Adelges cooleyi]|uniref:zinc finger protein 888-like isoform X2 n=1 Tax=Adelges cooleyi TaxID=133065 RepID=UPI00217FCA10|nr:zinc finger protein 888-like isoform X2 [Adelges cooleyi]
MDNEVSHLLKIMTSKENTMSKLRNSKGENNEDLKIENAKLEYICETSIENDAHKKKDKNKKRKNRETDIKVSDSLDISPDNLNTILKLKMIKKKRNNNIETNDFAASSFDQRPSGIGQSSKKKKINKNTSNYLNDSTDNDVSLPTIIKTKKIKYKELNTASSLLQSSEINNIVGKKRLEENQKPKSCMNILTKENILQTQYKKKNDLLLEKKKTTVNQNGLSESTYYMVKKLAKHLKEQKKNDINKVSVSTKECTTDMNNTSDNSSVHDINEKYVTCAICHEWFLNIHIYQHMQTHIDNLHKPDTYCKSLKKKADLIKHQIIDTTEGAAYKCSLCEKTYKHLSSLTVHYRIHTGESPFECDICDSMFTQKSSLSRHKRIHTGERPFKCDICDSAFVDNSHLSRHKLIHTGERPFKCDICDSTFTHMPDLINHNRIHTGERPFECDICDSAFTRMPNLINHNRIHTGERPFECDICDSAFTVKSNLSRHKLIHTGERPYSCRVCGLAFNQQSILIAHKRIHTGERPYKCRICSKDFRKTGNLTRHVKNVHNKA